MKRLIRQFSCAFEFRKSLVNFTQLSYHFSSGILKTCRGLFDQLVNWKILFGNFSFLYVFSSTRLEMIVFQRIITFLSVAFFDHDNML